MSVLLIVIIVTVLIIGMGVVYAIKRYGIFQEKQFNEQILLETEIIYYRYRGNYDSKLGKEFDQIVEDMKKVFAISRCFGIYYDPPGSFAEGDMRAIIGIVVNRGQLNKISKFLKMFSKYSHTTLPPTKCISVIHPYVNFLSHMIVSYAVYPKLDEYLKKNEIQSPQAIVEFYHFISHSNKTVEIIAPIQNQEAFYLFD